MGFSFTPDLHFLPSFLTRLVREVNWNDEGACFTGICRITASFYAKRAKDSVEWKPALGPSRDVLLVNSSESSDEEERKSDVENKASEEWPTSWNWTVEHVLLPAIRTVLLPTHTMCFPTREEKSPALIRLTSLPELYKVFERC